MLLKKSKSTSCVAVILTAIIALLVFGCEESEKPEESKSVTGTYEKALETAQQKGQKILIDFYTDWCYWCKVLDSATYSDSTVIAFQDSVVFTKINAEVDTTIAKKYSISGYPTIVLINADGTEIDRIGGYLPPVEFLEEVHNYLNGVGTLDDLLNRAQTEPTMEIYTAIGDKYSGRGVYDKAIEFYSKIINGDPDNKEGFTDDAMLAIGETYSGMKEYDKAIKQYEDVIQKYKGDSAAMDADFSIGRVYVRKDEYENAIAHFDKMIQKFEKTETEGEAMLWKGYIYRQIPDTAAAIEVYENFLKKFPESSDTTHAKEKLEGLKNPPPPEEEDSE